MNAMLADGLENKTETDLNLKILLNIEIGSLRAGITLKFSRGKNI